MPGLDQPTSIDFGASTDPERPTSIDLGASMYPERPPSIDFGPISHSISSSFFELTSCRQLVVQRDVTNPRFCWQARFLGRFAGVTTTPKIDPVRRKIASTMVDEQAVRTNYGVGRSWARLGFDFVHLRAPPGRSRPVPAHELDRSWPPGPIPIDPLRLT